MQTVNKTYEKIIQLVSDDGRYKVNVDYDSFSSAQEALDSARKQVKEYERSARAVLLGDLEARKVLMRWTFETLAVPQGLSVEEADEWRAKKEQEEGYSAGRLADDIFDDERSESTYYIFAPASDVDVRDFCTLLSMCGDSLVDSLGGRKYCFCCGQAQLKKGSKYLVQLGAGSDFPEIEWARVADMDALVEGVKALSKFVKNFK